MIIHGCSGSVAFKCDHCNNYIPNKDRDVIFYKDKHYDLKCFEQLNETRSLFPTDHIPDTNS